MGRSGQKSLGDRPGERERSKDPCPRLGPQQAKVDTRFLEALPRTPKTKTLCEAVDCVDEMEAFSGTRLRHLGPRWEAGRVSYKKTNGW